MPDAIAAVAPAAGTAPAAGSDTPVVGATTVAGTPAATVADATAAPAATTAETVSTDWRTGITDPEHLEFAKRTASIADLAKVGSDLRKANGSMTRVPGKDASPEDIAKFNKLVGVPTLATEYKFDMGREA